MFCPVCGAPNLDSAERCVSCGRALPKLSDAGTVAETTPTAAPPTQPWPVPDQNVPFAAPPTQPWPSAASTAPVAAPTYINYSNPAPSVYPNSQHGVSNYGNNPVSYNTPVDRTGVSSYDNLPPYSGPYNYNQPGVAGYGNNPVSYNAPIDRTGVSGYPNWNGPQYSTPLDRVGVARGGNNFWPRFGAYVIDQIICSFIFGLVFGIPFVIWISRFATNYGNEISNVCGTNSGYSYGRGNYHNTACNQLLNDIFLHRGELSSLLLTTVTTFVIGSLLVLTYQVLLTARGQTVGKRVFGLKVVRPDGSAPGFGTALLRQTIGYFVSSLIFGLGFLWVAFDPNNRGWHDSIANTYVVNV